VVKIWDVGKKRKRRARVPPGVIKQVVARAKGRCEKCGTKLPGLHYHIHHKDMDPSNNELSNLLVLCPNCHSRIGVHEPSEPQKEPSFDRDLERRMQEIEKRAEEAFFGPPKKRKKKSPDWGF